MHHRAGRYGAETDPQDDRDLLYAPMDVHAVLPQRVDLRPHCPPVHDQGDLGTCTAHAIAAAFQFEQKRLRLHSFPPSRLFIFYNQRSRQIALHQGTGVNLREGLKAVRQHGVCPEHHWPYRNEFSAIHIRPPARAYEAAQPHKILSYRRLTMGQHSPARFVHLLKSCLAEGFPFVFAFLVHESFESEEVRRSGVMPLPEHRESRITMHAVMAVGYDDHRKHVLVRNSWGPSWGHDGYFWMPYEYISRPEVTADFWTIRGVTG